MSFLKKIMDNSKKIIHVTGGLLIAVLAVILVCGYLYFNKTIESRDFKINELVGSIKTLEEVMEFADKRRYAIIQLSDSEQKREAFLIYGKRIITQHYEWYKLMNGGVERSRRMSDNEIKNLLLTIYDYAHTAPYSNCSDLFLPLAYATVETHFYPDAKGRDGERSIFQFMEMTAKGTYARINQPYNPYFYSSPEESVKLWFNHYYHISSLFNCEDEEKRIKFSAVAYNAGEGRIGLKYYFDNNFTLNEYFKEYPLKNGIVQYNRDIYDYYIKYRNGFYGADVSLTGE